MFIDEAKITVKAGDGGHGCIAFRREKFVPRGGPSGGDGGNGGNIYVATDIHENTLLKFRFNHAFRAERGRHGEGSKRHGRNGEDLEIKVPIGTVISDDQTGEMLHDFTEPNERVLIAKGGRGGHGNAHFATSVNRVPHRAQDGATGEEKTLRLELKLLADVGLVGYPNVGKSTLISRISAARPKIADYPFTTLEPQLGVVSFDGGDQTFVVADIPGLIEGAHLGHGLGIQFLRHIERTRILLHLIDVSGASERDPVDEFHAIDAELAEHNADLPRKPKIIVATKMDVADAKKVQKLSRWCNKNNYELLKISSVTGEGLDELKRAVLKKLHS
jgi:GTP-binding protein